ncbi:storkhead-box protein 2-like isoform X1 [Pseudochaenichthys georgianus]|uniref:storkhead-box protein 2-like isoform X1 n=2 Tax=Pseudochaenichthys georgianus TaxID=52239 RepID=UPI00146BBE06|nr:storkhead-box protein 2-like isoform X1 [Pseudochaenichthys georgianus]
MESFLQIAPHSLAIVLSRVGAGDAGGAAGVSESDALPRHHTGYEIFADFKAENTQHHVWNQRITEAVSETFFLGWIDEHVLLIQGKEDHLEVLREGWMRRSLNPPRGFTIKYLGDVSPISMSPISQSQFIPLGEVLLLAISAMNSAHKAVTQEALTEHLQTCFPGVPTPTEEVLHHTLSMLVRERKIYPTPDGYFIVTPQTYFITPSLIRTSSKWYHLDERSADRHHQQQQQQNQQQHQNQQHQQTQCTSPLSGTITPSTSGAVRERTHPKSSQNHSGGGGGDPFYNNSYRGDDPPSHHTTLQRRSPKDHREAYSSPHSPQTPPQPAGSNAEKSRSTLGFPFKTDTLTKHRSGGGGGGGGEIEKPAGGGSGTGSRKFGLKLFRLSFKKDKTKQLATFSAQFPPEEWPLRDEETPSQLPRHVEMEIIRRINPDLTVENLARHTAVMKRLEEERAQRSKASSANQSSRSRRSGGRHRKQSQTKLSRSHSKTRASRGEPSDLELDRDYRAYSSSLARSPREHALAMDRQRARLHLAHSNPNILESSHLPVTPEWDVSGELAKRRTEMPFPEPSHGPSAHHSKVHRSHSHTQERKSRNERSDKAKERSRSMDNSKGPLRAGLIGPPDYYDERSRYYTDDGTLRANQSTSHYSRATPTSNKLPADSLGLDGGRSLEKSKSRDSLPAYSPKPLLCALPPDDYFQCSGSSETALLAANSLGTLGRSSHDGLKLGSADRQTPHPLENKEDLSKLGPKGGSLPPIPLSLPDPPLPNGRPPHSASSGQEKRKEIFSKDTLFKPPPSLPLPGYSSLRKTPALASSTLSSSCDVLDSQEAYDAPKPLVATPSAPPQGIEPTTSAAEASFDYYNVSDDDELEEGGTKGRGEAGNAGGGVAGMGGGGAGTMQWLLEREKERDLQRRFERTLTFPGVKETLPEPSQNQQSAHSARLDSMDSSSVTVDSGFNSPRTRESLASNTSSIVESSRRQNLALSPGHLGIATGTGPPFSFRAIPEPAGTQPEKLQKPSACLASITSV